MISNLSVKKSCIFAFFFLLSLPLFSKEINIIWKWHPSEESISYYRYQKDGEYEDKWQVVDSTVNSYEVGPLDASKVHILYLQKSSDGINWSRSGVGIYNPETYAYPDSVVKSLEGKDIDYAEDKAVETEASDRASVDLGVSETEKINSNLTKDPFSNSNSQPTTHFGIELSSGLGILSDLDKSNKYADLPGAIFPAVSLDFILSNLVSYINDINLGIITGLGFQYYSPQVSRVQFLDVHALATWSYALDYNLSLRFGVGATALSPYANLAQNSVTLFTLSDINLFYGLVSKLNLQYEINNSFTLGLYFDGRMLFSNAFVPYEIDGFIGMTIGYHFK